MNGVLTARDILTLHLNADIVFLNGCNTANSSPYDIKTGVGLSTSFLTSGAKSIIVSHWSISVKATQQLREEIFKSAIKPSIRSYTEALNYGRKQSRKNQNFAHPFFWGAFKVYEPFSVNLSK